MYTANELAATAFRKVSPDLIRQLSARLIVAFVASQGGAAQAGVQIGDICTSVNGVAVSTAKQAASEVRKGSRPLALTFLSADIAMSLDEGFHMVKYDTTDVRPPYK